MELTMPTEPGNYSGKRNSRKVDNSVISLPQWAGSEVDPEDMFGIVGIVGTVLNLLVVVFVYIYTSTI